MDREQALKLLRRGQKGMFAWNLYRSKGGEIPSLVEVKLSRANLGRIDLSRVQLAGSDLSRSDLSGANLKNVDFKNADLTEAVLEGADLKNADLKWANLERAYLAEAFLQGVDLEGAHLAGADLRWADLRGTLLQGADLKWTNLTGVDLGKSYMNRTICGATIFGDMDLSEITGLDQVIHQAPSIVGVDTLLRSKGRIPEAFLQGCGMAPWEVFTAKLYDTAINPSQFIDIQYRIFDAWTKGKNMINGCFISYSWEDSKFVTKLCDHLRAEGVNIWLDKHDMVAGSLQDQVWRAIQVHHVVILVLSKDSIQSDWVENELDMARRKEKAEGRAILCPVAVDDSWKTKLDASSGPGDPSRALWRTLSSKLVMDFSPWKTKAFDAEFTKLVRGLKVNYGPKDPPAP